jgi:hypothetical protein
MGRKATGLSRVSAVGQKTDTVAGLPSGSAPFFWLIAQGVKPEEGLTACNEISCGCFLHQADPSPEYPFFHPI